MLSFDKDVLADRFEVIYRRFMVTKDMKELNDWISANNISKERFLKLKAYSDKIAEDTFK